MIGFTVKGDWSKTEKWLLNLKLDRIVNILTKYGDEGVRALSSATPIDSGETAASWGYKIERKSDSVSLIFTNSHINQGVPIAIILQYGHGTGTGGYVQGRDYINPAIQPFFDRLVEKAWGEVIKL